MAAAERSVAPIVTLGLAVLTLALIVVGLPVVFAPARTDRYFAWAIDPPLTAAFLGACYWTAALFTLLAVRERRWTRVRAVMPGILVAGTLILVATLVHLDRFAMDTARGWAWLILYAGLPPGTQLLLALQRRRGRCDVAPVLRPIERRAAVLLALAAAVLLIAGAALFALPATASGWWPWPLSELTARMVGAWLAAAGATLVAVVLEGDWSRTRAAMIYVAALAAAQLATLARHPGTVQWGEVSAWAYAAFLAGLLALALHGARAGRAERPVGSRRGLRAAGDPGPGRVARR